MVHYFHMWRESDKGHCQKNKEKTQAKKRAHYLKNKKKILAQQKLYYLKNIEKISAYSRIQSKKYHWENREAILVKKRIYNAKTFSQRHAYARKNRDSIKKRMDKHNHDIKFEVFSHYSKGKPKCACCEESIFEFLTTEHIDGKGSEHRRREGIKTGKGTYSWLKKNGYPSGFKILCFNCNCGQNVTKGVCPHLLKEIK